MDDLPDETVDYWITQAVRASVFGCALIIVLTLVACVFGVIILGQEVFN